jgi:hypothetical protein
MKKILTTLFAFCILTSLAFGQTDPTKIFWDSFIQEKTAEWAAKKAEARQISTTLGFPMRTELKDGTIFELMRFSNGFPLYYSTMNVDAAKTSNTYNLWDNNGYFFSLTGWSSTIGIWDGGAVRTRHIEFENSRATQMDGVSALSNHATHVAGTMIARGAVAQAKGMSYEANLSCYDWDNDISEMATAYSNDDLRLSNHSYGILTGWQYNFRNDGRWAWFGNPEISETEDHYFGFYSEVTQGFDEFCYNAPYYISVQSAGNDRDEVPSSQPALHWLYDENDGWVESTTVRDQDGGADGYDCISHAALAKNIITVGAVLSIPDGYSQPSDVIATDFTSWGPCDDGRIKPDIVADGDQLYSSIATTNRSYAIYSGTSMASPATTGSIGLLFQLWYEMGYSYELLSSSWKAILLHNAYEAGENDGPDYSFGWGLLNTLRSAQFLDENYYEGNDFFIREVTLEDGDTYEFEAYSDGQTPIKVTICWTDPEATPVINQLNPRDIMLINDLDITLEDSESSIHYPWYLDPDNPADAAQRGDNNVDNVEQVYISSPVAGFFTVSVTHEGTLQGDDNEQAFSMCISGLTPEIKPKLAFPEPMKDKVEIPCNFQWYSLPDADSYTLQVSSGVNFLDDDIVIDQENITRTNYEGTISELDPETYYWWRVKAVIDGEDTEWSTVRIFKTARVLDLCEAGSDECDEFISNVKLGAIDNSSDCSAGGYENYMYISTDVQRGYTYNMKITNGFPYSSDECGVWVDWNGNGDFTDDGEEMNVTGGPNTFEAEINVPENAPLESVPVRIRILYNDTPEPCGIAEYGEVEDYTLNVTEPDDHCQAGSENCSEYISRVKLIDLDNPSSCSESSYGYSDYTAISTDYEAGTGTMEVHVGNLNDNDIVGVWIDWNRDGDFTDLRDPQNVIRSNDVFMVNIQPPIVILLGEVRMRVRVQRGGSIQSCGVTEYGEVEDYTLNIIMPIEELDPPILTTPIDDDDNVSMNPRFIWENVENADDYNIQVATDDDFSSPIINYVSEYENVRFVNFLNETNTDHFWRVKARNSQTESQWSDVWMFTTEKYCSASSAGSDYIRNVAINTIDNASSNEQYGDFRHISTGLDIGINYQIDIETISLNSYCDIWVDWDQNGTFTGANEHFTTIRDGMNFTGTITAPWLALTGETRMRVRLGNEAIASPCGRSINGEVEDYTLNLQYVQVSPPELLSPDDNSTDLETDLAFSWSQVIGANQYQIEIAEDIEFTENVFSDYTFIPYFEYDGLDYYTNYWWRVKAINPGYESGWSDVFSFRTEAAEVPDSWAFESNTGSRAEIIVPVNIDPTIGERQFIPGDAVGAFYMDGDEIRCGGYGLWWGGELNVTVWRDNPLTPEKDGFDPDEDFIIRIWDALRATDHAAIVEYRDGDPDHYTNNGESYLTHLEADLGAEQIIELTNGWNFISSYIELPNSDIEELMAGVADDILLVKDISGDMYFPSLGINSIGNWISTEGYKVYVLQQNDLILQGEQIIPEETPIEMSQGWNLIAYLRASEYDIEDIMSDIEDNLLIVKNVDGELYFPSLDINSIINMIPGEAYQVYMTSTDELIYPANSSPKAISSNKEYTKRTVFNIPSNIRTGENMVLIVDAGNNHNGNELCVFDQNSILVGSALIEKGIAAVTIWGDNSYTDKKDGCIVNEKLTVKIYNSDNSEYLDISIKDIKSMISGKKTHQLEYLTNDLLFAKSAIEESDKKSEIVEISPNPASKEAELRFYLTEESICSYEIYDNSGKLICSEEIGQLSAGESIFNIPLGEINAGSYRIIIRINNSVITKPLIIVK